MSIRHLTSSAVGTTSFFLGRTRLTPVLRSFQWCLFFLFGCTLRHRPWSFSAVFRLYEKWTIWSSLNHLKRSDPYSLKATCRKENIVISRAKGQTYFSVVKWCLINMQFTSCSSRHKIRNKKHRKHWKCPLCYHVLCSIVGSWKGEHIAEPNDSIWCVARFIDGGGHKSATMWRFE